jgi:hypothetical protein
MCQRINPGHMPHTAATPFKGILYNFARCLTVFVPAFAPDGEFRLK